MNDSLALDFDRLETGLAVTTRGRTITESDLVSFSALTGDWHPQHADADWAAEGPFGERVAHGMLVLSYAVGLLPIDPDAGHRAARAAPGRLQAPGPDRDDDPGRGRGRRAAAARPRARAGRARR